MSITINLPHAVGLCKHKIPQSVGRLCQDAGMKRKTPNQILWENVSALMEHSYGRENLTRLANDSGCGPGTMTRIKNQQTSVGLDVLSKLAKVFSLSEWQLLTPNLDPKNPPVVWMTAAERDLYARLKGIVEEAKKTIS